MAVIAPQTTVYLLKVPLEMDNTNQLTFASASAQFNYFNGLPKLDFDNFTYQRKDNIIRIPAVYDDIMQYNYVMYQNEAYGNKWFYAYIDHMEYVNDSVTAVSISTDTWQTWQFDLTFKPVFVEREHVNDDTVGNNILPEDFELGDFVVNGSVIDTKYGTGTAEVSRQSWYVMAASDVGINGIFTPDIEDTMSTHVIAGSYSGLYYFFFLDYTNLQKMITEYNRVGKANAIVSIFRVPFSIISQSALNLVTFTKGTGQTQETISCWRYTADTFDPIDLFTQTITKPTSLNGYTPKNGKMLTYPFNYLEVSNNAGMDVTYNYEDFNGNPEFKGICAVVPSMSIKMYPTNYKNTTGKDCYNFGMSGAKFPICGWTTDAYQNWLSQNAVNIGLQAGGTLISAVGAAATGVSGLARGAVSALEQIGGILGSIYKASKMPDQAQGNINTGDVNFSANKVGYTFTPMSIKQSVARVIDEYFSMFGYKVNRVKIPNITGRRNWNYVKTVSAYIQADIPQEDLQTIKDMFNRGVTFWHNPSTFADYTQNNDIIS